MPDVEKRITQNGKQDCCGCKLCEEICPKQCIAMQYDEEGFWYPHIDKKQCSQCGLCNKICPNVNMINEDFEPQIYAAYARDKEICATSSSGGIFQLLARTVILGGGVVYGAAFDDLLSVHHMRATTLQELEKLFGSKYVQSDMQGIYSLVRADLKKGKKVLFSGTPCQVSAIKQHIGREDVNLLLVDIVCYGVPSPAVWLEYIQSQKRMNRDVKKFIFRSKEEKNDWENYKWKTEYDNGEIEQGEYSEFLYGKAFSDGLSLRPSCYECQFLALRSGADITLGDCWGFDKVELNIANSWGMSIVSVNSEKGCSCFEEIRDNCVVESTDIAMLEQWNSAFQSVKEHPARNMYLEYINNGMDRLQAIKNCLDCVVPEPKNILLFGSYNARVVVRDTFENLYEQYSYSSLRSLMNFEQESLEILELDEMPKDFIGQMLYKDKKKLFIREIEKHRENVDYILIDFLEERFPVVCEKGVSVTQNVDCFEEGCTGERDYQKEFQEWTKACESFINLLYENFNKEQIIFMESYLSTHWGMHGKYGKFKDLDDIEQINQYLKRCNDFFIERSGIDKIIKIPDNLLYCQKYHRFGCKPYHLNYDAYQNLGRQLKKLIRE